MVCNITHLKRQYLVNGHNYNDTKKKKKQLICTIATLRCFIKIAHVT